MRPGATLVVDTSALVAILFREVERENFLLIIGQHRRCLMSALTRFELDVVMLGRLGRMGLDQTAALLDLLKLEVVVFDAQQAAAATAAYARYGKGIHPQARLNLADCAAYALATTLGVPLLFKGADFAVTEVLRAI